MRLYPEYLRYDFLAQLPIARLAEDRDATINALEGVIRIFPSYLNGTTLEEPCKAKQMTDLFGVLASNIDHASDLIHLLRYTQGCYALALRDVTRWGDDPIGECADLFNIHATTLRLYTAAAKVTRSDVYAFDRFLREGDRRKTQADISRFTSLMKHTDIVPEEAARQIRAEKVERASRDIEQAINEEASMEHRDTLVLGLAAAAGVQVEFTDTPPAPPMAFRSNLAASIEGLLRHTPAEFIAAARLIQQAYPKLDWVASFLVSVARENSLAEPTPAPPPLGILHAEPA